MPTEHIIALLIAERDKLDRAIAELGGSIKKRRGRPPKNPALAVSGGSNLAPASAKPHYMRSAAARKAQAARMRAYWAKRKHAAKKGQA